MDRIPPKLQPWFHVRKELGLSNTTIQMARELGMNPRKLGRLVPTIGQQWKASLHEFIADCYEKSHGRRTPENIRSLEQIINDDAKRKDAKRATKAVDSNSSNERISGQESAL